MAALETAVLRPERAAEHNTAVHSLKASKCRDNEKRKNAVSIRKEKKITEPWVIVLNFTTTKKPFLPLIQFRVETIFTSLTS